MVCLEYCDESLFLSLGFDENQDMKKKILCDIHTSTFPTSPVL